MSQFECAIQNKYKRKLLSGVMLAPLVAAAATTAMLSFSLPLMAAQDANDESVDFDEIVVVGKKYYRHKEATSGTKMNMQLKDTPQSIKVITADVIKAASIREFEDVYKVDASGGTSHSRDGFPRNFYRGFAQQGDSTIKVDGFRMPANLDLDFATFERFEIVKGPTSTLYGQNPIGGTLNAVSKTPQDEFGLEISGEIGSYDHYRGDLDVTGPLSEDGRWSYRFITAYEDADSYIDLVENSTFVVAPSLQFKPSDQTTINAKIHYEKHDDVYDFGGPFIRTTNDEDDPNFNVLTLPDLPRSRFFGMELNGTDREAFFATLSADHDFDNGWTLKSNFQYANLTNDSLAFLTLQQDADGFGEFNVIYGLQEEEEVFSGEINLFGDVEAFGQDHTLFLGVDYSKTTSDTNFAFGLRLEDWNVFDPDHTAIEKPDTFEDIVGSIYGTIYQAENEVAQYGATVQALIRPTEKLSLMLGGRYSITEVLNAEDYGDGFETVVDETAKEVTFQFGMTYALTDDMNLYAMYGETFEPEFGRVSATELVQPERGTSYEAGIKGDYGEMSYSLAVFDMKRTNIVESIPFSSFVRNVGTQQSRGVEFEFSGELLPNWNIFGSAAYLDAEFIEGQFIGLTPANAPEFGLSLFTGYQFDEGALEGFGVGGGIVYKSNLRVFDGEGGLIVGDSFATYDFGSIFELDARVYYEQDNWEVDLSATNLTNTKYYSAARNILSFGIAVNPPRLFRLGFSYKM